MKDKQVQTQILSRSIDDLQACNEAIKKLEEAKEIARAKIEFEMGLLGINVFEELTRVTTISAQTRNSVSYQKAKLLVPADVLEKITSTTTYNVIKVVPNKA